MARNFLFFSLILFPFQNVFSAELHELGHPNIIPTTADIQRGEVLLDGEIQKGDFHKIIKYLKSRPQLPTGFSIRSNGGDIIEAEMIGRLFRETLLSIYVIEYCYSACFFIISASSNRIVPYGAQVGIHRPRYYKEYFKELSGEKAGLKYLQLQSSSRNYLKAMDVPLNIIDKMFSTPAENLYLLTAQEKEFLNGEHFAAGQWIKNKCNPLTPGEYGDFKKRSITGRYLTGDEPPAGISREYWIYLIQKNDNAMTCLAKVRNDRLRAVLEKYN